MPERNCKVMAIAKGRVCGDGGMAVGDSRRAGREQRAFQARRIRGWRLQSRVLAGMHQAAQMLQRVHLRLLLHAEQQQGKEQCDERAVPGGDQGIDAQRQTDRFSLTRNLRAANRPGYIVCDANFGASTSSASSLVDGSLMVMRHSVRGSSGSVSVAECSSDALSQITMSPTA